MADLNKQIHNSLTRIATANRFRVVDNPRHTHSTVNSPQLPGTSVSTFLTVPGLPDGVLPSATTVPTTATGQYYEFLNGIGTTPVLNVPIPIIYGYGTTSTTTITSAALAGATSATLSGAWGGSTEILSVQFDSLEVRNVQFTAGSTAITWLPPLQLSNVSTTLTILANAAFKGGNAPDGTMIIFRNDDAGVLQLWVRTMISGVLLYRWAGVDLGGTGLEVFN